MFYPIHGKDYLKHDYFLVTTKELVEKEKTQHIFNQKRFIESNLFEKRIKERARQNVQKEIEFEAQVKFEISKLKTKFAGRKDAIDLAIKRVKSDKKLNKDVIEKIVEKLEKVKAYEAANGKAAFSSLPNLGTTLEEITHNVKVKKLLKEEKKCNPVVVVLVIIGVIVVIAAAAYAIYRFFAPDYLGDFEDDEFEDEFDEDFFEDDEIVVLEDDEMFEE